MVTRKNIIWLLTLGWSWSHEMLPSTLYIMWTTYMLCLKLLHRTVKEMMHLQENNYLTFDIGVKVTQYVAQYHLY